MPRITRLEADRRDGPLRLYLDGVFAFPIDPILARQHHLAPGAELTTAQAEAIRHDAEHSRVAEASWRLLAIRPRSRAELRARLLRRGLPESAVDAQLDHLQELGYLDDAQFARFWVNARQSVGAPRGAALLRAELRKKGVDAELAREASDAGDEAAAALAAARTRASRLRSLPYPEFRQRLYGYLLRRGFDYEAARAAVRATWLEQAGNAAGEDG
jgi:regulatory protein